MNYLHLANLIHLLIITLLIIHNIYRQVTLRPVKPRKYIILPIIFIYITLSSITQLGETIIYKEAMQFILLASLGIISGIISGIITKIFTGDDGVLYQKGGLAATLILLIVLTTRYFLRHSLAYMPGGALLDKEGLSYLIILSSQLLSRSITMLIRCPQIFNLYVSTRQNRRRERMARRAQKYRNAI